MLKATPDRRGKAREARDNQVLWPFGPRRHLLAGVEDLCVLYTIDATGRYQGFSCQGVQIWGGRLRIERLCIRLDHWEHFLAGRQDAADAVLAPTVYLDHERTGVDPAVTRYGFNSLRILDYTPDAAAAIFGALGSRGFVDRIEASFVNERVTNAQSPAGTAGQPDGPPSRFALRSALYPRGTGLWG